MERAGRTAEALIAGAVLAGSAFAIPNTAAAQALRAYGSGDLCASKPRAFTIAGASAVLRCTAYPAGNKYHRSNCRWVEEDYQGHVDGFEVCRDRDGVWRPSGRG
jgi:hypothetical protein